MSKVAVIGAGVFGAWSAYWLAEAGHDVTLIDAYGPANGRASSADHSRVIRAGYGADEIYSRWACESLDQWWWLSRESGQEFVAPSGAMFMAPPGNEYIRATAETLSRIGRAVRVLSAVELSAKFPQIDPSGLGDTIFEPDAGILRARLSVQRLVRLMCERGSIEYRLARAAPPDEQAVEPLFRLLDGDRLRADTFVCACGPWLPLLFPSAVGNLIRSTRQEVLHFGIPAGDPRFSVGALPVWIDFEAGLYGIPDLDANGFKVGIDRHGPAFDPDASDRLVSPALIGQTKLWLARRFPALRDAPLIDARVCQYENTWSGDFLIDHHPAWSNVWIVGGGSGHGFKHGPAIGKHLAALLGNTASVNPRFSFASKRVGARRSVY